MGYGDPDPLAHKTGRIAILCLTVGILGLLFFLFKIDACSHKPENCQDEFIEIKLNNDSYGQDHKCSPGAIVEVISSPPAPKPGLLCHCPKNNSGTQSAPAASSH